MACFKGLVLTFDGKIKDNGLWCAILDNLHTIMYMPTELNESIETFMTCGRNKIIESFTQQLPNASWIRHFWTYYFQVGTWINSQSIIVVPPCYAYPKIFTPCINVETPMMDLAIPCGYCVSCYKFVNGGASTSATFKPGHTSIHSVLPWGIETLVLFGNKRASRSGDWLVSVETQNNDYKTLHAHG
jgi:hypothetical protein